VAGERYVDRVFLTADGVPRLARCAVLFLDLLGVQAMNQGEADAVERNLVAVERAVTSMYRDYLREDSPWPASFFSDTLVLAAAVEDDDDAYALYGLVQQAAQLQVDLYSQGFFARGGLALGSFHIRDGIVFGPGLVEAYGLESRRAVHPRIILSTEAVNKLRDRHAEGGLGDRTLLMSDHDGWTFVDYLSLLFDDVDEPGGPLAEHRDLVVDRLDEHRRAKRVWEKYRWVAEYHNAVVRGEASLDAELLIPDDKTTWMFTPFGDAAAG
jgi:hypothetical protein